MTESTAQSGAPARELTQKPAKAAELEAAAQPAEEVALDFGAGNIVVMPSRCLRVATTPTHCDVCVTACPVGALVPKPLDGQDAALPGAGKAQPATAVNHGVTVTEACIHCGLCEAVCPVEALTATLHHPKGLEKKLTEKAEEGDGLGLGCERALFGAGHRASERALALPCLAALGPESWFLAAALAHALYIDSGAEGRADNDATSSEAQAAGRQGWARILLPPLLCKDCPANAGGGAEAAYEAAIAEAEAWGAHNLDLVTTAAELWQTGSGRLVDSLNEVQAGGKRELVESLAATLGRTWQNAGDELAREKQKNERLAEQRNKLKPQPVPQKDLVNKPRPFGKKSMRRTLLRAALEQAKAPAQQVELPNSTVKAQLCTGCKICVDACPLGARKLVASSSQLYFGSLPAQSAPQGEEAAIVDKLCCMGCSACVQLCPTGAATLDTLGGKAFLALRVT